MRKRPGFSQPSPRTLNGFQNFHLISTSQNLSLSQRHWFIVILGICIEFVRFKRRMTKGMQNATRLPLCKLLAEFACVYEASKSKKCGGSEKYATRLGLSGLNLLSCLPGRSTPTNTRIKLGSIDNGFLPRLKRVQ